MRKRTKSLQEERFSEANIMEILVTGFVVVIITFFFIKILFF
jgi:hypothetical protein